MSAEASECFEVFWEETLEPDQGCCGQVIMTGNNKGTIKPPTDKNGQYFYELVCI